MKLLQHILTRRMAVTLLLGFSSGLPFRLIGDTLQVWMNETGRSLATIGLFTLVGLPYTLKFLWAPLFDHFVPPFLGRRRGWMLITQAAVCLALLLLAACGPAASLWLCAGAAVFVSLCSASQDIVLDAHRRDSLRDEELAFGSSLFVTGYRVGMLAAGPAALLLSLRLPWPAVYAVMAVLMLVGAAGTLLAPEPPAAAPPSLGAAIKLPLQDFFERHGVCSALLILLFIVFYKLGDSMASTMLTPFILEMGYSKEQLALAAETLGLFATLGGGMLGGLFVLRLGIVRCLWLFGLLQAVSTALFMLLTHPPLSVTWLSAVIIFEKGISGMSAIAFVAFLMQLTNRSFSATQYALLTSMMGVAPKILSAQSGVLAAALHWNGFFLACSFAALPGLVLLYLIAPRRQGAGTTSSSLANGSSA